MQSHNEVLDVLSNNPKFGPLRKIPVLSISPQSIASLASSISLPPDAKHPTRSILRRIRTFCKSVLGFEHVFDTTFARHLALKEHVQEFDERKRGDTGAGKLPMLASACPGWVCYAEKTHSEMLPFIARTKSPQQVMGTLVKEWMGKMWDKT
jgi:iron only hydrogenase large subunit-like protein